MSFLEDLAAKRQKLLDGIDANDGDIDLRIFEDFYPDEAHFIYELLQNAEDAGAREVTFELHPDKCVLVHDGTRHFEKEDVQGITGIFNSSKKGSPDKIGKFGVGFKSVFVYTETPLVYSKYFSFRIERLVLPRVVKPLQGLGEKTRFELPFNNPKKPREQAFSEVFGGLKQLSETTLLFLRNIQCISWSVAEHRGSVLRVEHPHGHVEILSEGLDGNTRSTHWLRFLRAVESSAQFSVPIEGLGKQNIAVAFELHLNDEAKPFDASVKLSKQFRVVPATQGLVSIFFPAEKETSGLRFHLHAPFIPELSRASIKNSLENLPLFEQLGRLAASSLHQIKDLGLLTGEFLAVLPNKEDVLPERYVVIRTSVMEEMKKESLVPKHGKGHGAASQLLQARAPIKALLSKDDLKFLFRTGYSPEWAIGATQRNSNQDRFLGSLGIKEWDVEELKDFLVAHTRQDSAYYLQQYRPEVVQWIASHPDEWLQTFYAVLYKYCHESDDYLGLNKACIVRRADGTMSAAAGTYFPTESQAENNPFPRISIGILAARGKEKRQAQDARSFLEAIGVKSPGETEEIALVLSQRYGQEATAPIDEVYLPDLQRFMDFLEREPAQASLFSDAHIFKVGGADFDWGTSKEVFLDEPYRATALTAHYATLGDTCDRWPLSNWYLDVAIDTKRLAQFAARCGAATELPDFLVKTTCLANPKWDELQQVGGERWTSSSINEDYALAPRVYASLEGQNAEYSKLIWGSLNRMPRYRLYARYRRNMSGGCRERPAQFTHALASLQWVPLSDGRFVKPSEASSEQLPPGFSFDSGKEWLSLIGFARETEKQKREAASRTENRVVLGFKTEDSLKRAQLFSRLPEREQERILSQSQQMSPEARELPEQRLLNAESRGRRVQVQASETPTKKSQTRSRAVAVDYESAKLEAKLYLESQYTNPHGIMFCQACQEPLPFRLPNGKFYFEAVEALLSGAKRFREGFLALCPNHAAMYQYANHPKHEVADRYQLASGREVPFSLAGTEVPIYFTEVHLADLQSCLSSLDTEQLET